MGNQFQNLNKTPTIKGTVGVPLYPDPDENFKQVKAHYERNGKFCSITREQYNQLPDGTDLLTVTGVKIKKDKDLTKKIEELKSEGISDFPYGLPDISKSQEKSE